MITITKKYWDFLDLMLGYSLIPKFTLPTRMVENSCSLIDNIFCTISPNYILSQAGIICSKISDHHPYVLSICPNNKEPQNNKGKYVKQRPNTGEAYGRLKQELVDNDVTNMMDNDPYCNPNYNYDILHNHLIKLKNEHLPYRMALPGKPPEALTAEIDCFSRSVLTSGPPIHLCW